MEDNITIDEKIRLLKIYLDNANDEHKINKLFDIYKDKNTDKKEFKEIDEIPKNIIEVLPKASLVGAVALPKKESIIKIKLDKNSYKCIIFLKVLNKILMVNEMNGINDVYEFKNMTKEQLIKDKDANNLFGLDKDVFNKKDGFDKNKCHWYDRRKIDNYILSFIKGACEELGINFSCKYGKKAVNNKIVNFVSYSIN